MAIEVQIILAQNTMLYNQFMLKVATGEIFWLTTKSDIRHPHVVIAVKEKTVMVCQLTSNQSKASFPGTVVLNEGECGLDKKSIVETSKVAEVPKVKLEEYVGQLGERRTIEIQRSAKSVKRYLQNEARSRY